MKTPVKFALVISAARDNADIVGTMKTMFTQYPDVRVQILDSNDDLALIASGLGFGMSTDSEVLVKFKEDKIPDFDWQSDLTKRIESDSESIIKTPHYDAFVLEPIARKMLENQSASRSV